MMIRATQSKTLSLLRRQFFVKIISGNGIANSPPKSLIVRLLVILFVGLLSPRFTLISQKLWKHWSSIFAKPLMK